MPRSPCDLDKVRGWTETLRVRACHHGPELRSGVCRGVVHTGHDVGDVVFVRAVPAGETAAPRYAF